jgi:hypothetical protein
VFCFYVLFRPNGHWPGHTRAPRTSLLLHLLRDKPSQQARRQRAHGLFKQKQNLKFGVFDIPLLRNAQKHDTTAHLGKKRETALRLFVLGNLF